MNRGLNEEARPGDGQAQGGLRIAMPTQLSPDVLRLISGEGITVRIYQHRSPSGRFWQFDYWREWLKRDRLTGELIQEGIANNIVLNSAQATLLQRLFGIAGSSRSITQVAVGSGTTAPAATQTALVTQITFKAIASVNQAGEASNPPSRICLVTFGSSEANGAGTEYIRELGFLFDNNVIVTRAVFAQGTITGATQANPVVITSAGVQAALTAANGGNGSAVYIEGVAGMTQLNGNHYTVANLATNTFELSGINGTAYGAFTASSPETAKWTLEFQKTSAKVLEISYPFALEC